MYCVSYGVNLAKISVYFVDNWLGTWADRKFLSDDRIFSHRPHLNRSCQIFNSDLLWKPKNFLFCELIGIFLSHVKSYKKVQRRYRKTDFRFICPKSDIFLAEGFRGKISRNPIFFLNLSIRVKCTVAVIVFFSSQI